MEFPFTEKKAKAWSLALLLFILAIITYWNFWWPGVMLAIGLPKALKHGLMKKFTEMSIYLVVFVGIFITVQMGMGGRIIAALLLFFGSLYHFIKDFKEEKKQVP